MLRVLSQNGSKLSTFLYYSKITTTYKKNAYEE